MMIFISLISLRTSSWGYLHMIRSFHHWPTPSISRVKIALRFSIYWLPCKLISTTKKALLRNLLLKEITSPFFNIFLYCRKKRWKNRTIEIVSLSAFMSSEHF
jgi:hypothetical protein